MPLTKTALPSLPALFDARFDAVIDVRSPAEYAEDHLPGAINLPVLDDEERARVGTIYKQQSPFLARKIGAALVARNAARHLEGPLAGLEGGWRPLVYCWRGGQRSGSFATILSQVGWRVEVLDGGYKAWRRLVIDALTDAPPPCGLWVLDGNTGSAKTELLHRLRGLGVQVVDLEGLANHRGSLFGHMAGGQPGQKAFEGRLALALAGLDPARPVVVEAESSRIGDLLLPKGLWAAMGRAPRLRIAAPLTARARYLARAYADLTADAARLASVIDSLRPLHPAERIEEWQALAASGGFETLAEGLMREHYDPRYEKHRARFGSDADRELACDNLEPEALDVLAGRIAAAMGEGG
ncbi:MAG: tRNA 2-selenouridine(34) synthase MnmH [Proteobacteria bacterium]|nr:tRNA 2-selenouridine(34) synthase MnmH [Pseudomonadota bacterium]MBS0574737.1 tRNA 2-selenouridine(34) synthase MnmH [Pseudomonadota bacterium]